MGSNRRQRRVEPSEDWEQIELLCAWPEQRDYELIRPSVLFGTSAAAAQPRLFGLDALGEAGWLKALGLEGYAPRRPRGPLALQQALFPYTEAL